MANIDWDTSDFVAKTAMFTASVKAKVSKGVGDIADEVLRLSQFEVPHDTGLLQNTGAVEPGENEYERLVGYNTVYAAYQHEGMRADGSHIVTQWQNGRKKKYLEDPIRNNLDTFQQYLDNIFNP